MGCLNAGQGWQHKFGNIHLSGPCNRSCYFCIGNHTPGQNGNNLNTWPLLGLSEFFYELKRQSIHEINLTGTNTDPTLYRHPAALAIRLRDEIPQLLFGVRTNGVLLDRSHIFFDIFKQISVSIMSLDPDLYVKTMGGGAPPDYEMISDVALSRGIDLRLNIVLTPETSEGGDIYRTIEKLSSYFPKINLREPYGQPHVGNPMHGRYLAVGERFGMPVYSVGGTEVMYWDVHYVQVESLNLYANGHISTDYAVSLGHDPKLGEVHNQEFFS